MVVGLELTQAMSRVFGENLPIFPKHPKAVNSPRHRGNRRFFRGSRAAPLGWVREGAGTDDTDGLGGSGLFKCRMAGLLLVRVRSQLNVAMLQQYSPKFKPSKYFPEHSFLSHLRKLRSRDMLQGQAQQDGHPQPDI